MIKPFSFRIVSSEPDLVIQFIGSIVQEEKFPLYYTANKIVLDLKECNYVNSIGISRFVLWLNEHKQTKVTMNNVPVIFMRQMAAVVNFKMSGLTISSLYVPFYSEALDETREVLLTEGVNYSYKDSSVKLPILKDTAGNPMELDVDERSYFSFLKK